MSGRVTNEDRRKAKAALGELGEVRAAVESVAQLCADERARVLSEVEDLVEGGGNPGEIGVLCEELREGVW